MPQQPKERAWSVVRICFGVLQTIGATTSLLLLIGMGLSRPAIVAATLTGCFTVMSLILWGGRSDNIPFRWKSRD